MVSMVSVASLVGLATPCLRVERRDVPTEYGGDAEGAFEDALEDYPLRHETDLPERYERSRWSKWSKWSVSTTDTDATDCAVRTWQFLVTLEPERSVATKVAVEVYTKYASTATVRWCESLIESATPSSRVITVT